MSTIECGICTLDVDASDIVTCSEGCQFCEDCVRRAMTDAAFEGRSATRVAQCKGDCGGHYSVEDVARLLSEEAYKKLVRSAENEDVWAIKPQEGDQYYHCRDCDRYWIGEEAESQCPDCGRTICGGCWEDINGELGCRCSEEEAQSEAEVRSKVVIRKCPRCRTPFVKEQDGCNHVTCSVCEADICYYCGKWFQGHSIYDEHFGDDEPRCPMYSSYETLHEERATEAAERFRGRTMV